MTATTTTTAHPFACFASIREVPVAEMTRTEREICTLDGVTSRDSGWTVYEVVDPRGVYSVRTEIATARLADVFAAARALAAKAGITM